MSDSSEAAKKAVDSGTTDGVAGLVSSLRGVRARFAFEPLHAAAVGQSRRKHPGFLLHSLLGPGLRATACGALGCNSSHRAGCAYDALFGQPSRRPDLPARAAFGISPFAVDASWGYWDGRRPLPFEIVLLGDAARHAEAVEHALAWAVRQGLREEGSFGLDRNEWRPVAIGPPPQLRPAARMQVDFRTPVRLVRNGEPQRVVSLEDIARDAAFRAASWATHHQGAEWRDLWPEVEPDVRRCVVHATRQEWADAVRYSAGQRRGVPSGGVQGWLRLVSPGPALLAVLRAAEVCGVGKNSSSGLGRIRLSIEGAEVRG